MKIVYRDLVYKLILLSIIVYPINYTIGGLRLLDFIFFLMFFLSLKFVTVKKNNLLIVLPFFILLVLSIMMGDIFTDNALNYERIIFIYKYSYPFILIMILYNLNLTKNQLDKIFNFALFSYIVLVLWVYLYLYLKLHNMISGSFRPSFPFSNDFWISDAHLYSATLAVGLLFFSLFKNYSIKYKIPFVIISFGAIILTGSRSGLLVFIIGIFIYGIVNIKKFIVYLPIIIGTISVFMVLSNFIEIPHNYMLLVERASNFDVSNDASSMGRITKMLVGINDSSYILYLLGVGLMQSSYTWYDSLVGILMSHVGLLGFISFFFVLYVFRLNTINIPIKSHYKIIFTIVLYCYIIANFITEYFFISRSVFPIVIYLFILHYSIKSQYEESKIIRI